MGVLKFSEFEEVTDLNGVELVGISSVKDVNVRIKPTIITSDVRDVKVDGISVVDNARVANITLSDIKSDITHLQTNLTLETIDRTNADGLLSNRIDGLNNDLSSEVDRAIAASQANTNNINLINGKINDSFVQTQEYQTGPTTIYNVLEKKNIFSGASSFEAIPFPIATETDAGAISAEGYAQIISNTNRISNLEQTSGSGEKRITVQNTKSQLLAFVLPPDAAEGDTAVVRQDESQNGYTTEYVLDASMQWQFLFIINTTTPTASQTVVGSVKGSTDAGKVFVETDATMSVVGWDALNASIPTNISQLTNDTGYVTVNNINANIQSATSTVKGIATLGASGGAARYGQKGDVGLSNVNNTSDLSKPVSNATQAVLDTKATDSNVVHNTGNEFVSGTKTFQKVMLSLDPTEPLEAATKQFVEATIDDAVENISVTIGDGFVRTTGDQSIDGTKTFQKAMAASDPVDDMDLVSKSFLEEYVEDISKASETPTIPGTTGEGFIKWSVVPAFGNNNNTAIQNVVFVNWSLIKDSYGGAPINFLNSISGGVPKNILFMFNDASLPDAPTESWLGGIRLNKVFDV